MNTSVRTLDSSLCLQIETILEMKFSFYIYNVHDFDKTLQTRIKARIKAIYLNKIFP